MNIIWLVILLSLSSVAITATVIALVVQRAPRAPVDPERLARLRDDAADREARRIAAEVEQRIQHRLDAPGNGLAPQLELNGARLWSGAV